MIESIPRFLQGVFAYTGGGYDKPIPLDDALAYAVPPDKRAQPIYLRAGNSGPELAYLVLMRDGRAMRYFPIGAKAGAHVPLAVVEDIDPGSKLEILIGAPAGASGTVVLDLGLLEI